MIRNGVNVLWDAAEILNCTLVYDRIYTKIESAIEKTSGISDDETIKQSIFEICMDLNELLINVRQFLFASIRQEKNGFEACKKYLNNIILLQRKVVNVLKTNLNVPEPIIDLSEVGLTNKIKEIQRTTHDLLNIFNRSFH